MARLADDSALFERTPVSRLRWAYYTPLIAAVVSSILAFWKGWVWWQSHSLAVEASFIDSGLDACTSIINFWALRTALRPADDCHRYGHDKAEALASLGQSLLMLGLGLYVGWQAFLSLTGKGTALHVTEGSLHMMALSTLAALGLVVMQTLAAKRISSLAIKTDVLHYRADVLTNLGVFVTLWLGEIWLDGLVALGLSIYLAKSAWHLIQESGHILMDGELDDETRESIKSVILAHPKVHSLNHLRTRFSGHTQFIQLNVVLDAHLSLSEAHVVAHQLEASLCADNPNVKRDVTIHQEPFE